MLAKSCRIFSDVLTKVADDRYYYPDVVVTCAPLSARGVILSPCVEVKVTSPSTRTTIFAKNRQRIVTAQLLRASSSPNRTGVT